MELTEMSATRMAAEIRSGAITAEQLIKACLNKIACIEETVQAWSFLDPHYALDQARAADQRGVEGRPLKRKGQEKGRFMRKLPNGLP